MITAISATRAMTPIAIQSGLTGQVVVVELECLVTAVSLDGAQAQVPAPAGFLTVGTRSP